MNPLRSALVRSEIPGVTLVLLGFFLGGCRAGAASVDGGDAPRVFTLRAETLLRNREELRAGSVRLQPAYDELLAEARESLEAGPFTVMDKERLPPSGDKHDYVSYGPYWWPDPDQPDGLPYIRRDGERNPASQSLAESDRQRLGAMMDAVETLGLAYFFTEDERYAEHATDLLRVWFLDPATRMNPHLEYGQSIPGITDGRGIGIIDTRGLSDVVDAIGMIAPSDHWTEADQQGMRAWFGEYLGWLVNSEKGQDEREYFNNHGTWWDVQATAMALFVADTTLAREIVEQSRTRRVASHIEPDGRQPKELERTRSLSYSLMNLEGMVRLAELARHVGVDLWEYETSDGRSIRKAVDFLASYADGSKQWPYEQITEVEPSSFLPLLRLGAAAYDEPAYEALITRMGDQDGIAADRGQLVY